MLLAIERQGGRRRIALYVLRHSGIIKSSCIYPRRVCVSKESCSSRLTRKRVKIWGETERERDMSNAAREIEQAQNNESDMSTCTCTYLCIILSVYVHVYMFPYTGDRWISVLVSTLLHWASNWFHRTSPTVSCCFVFPPGIFPSSSQRSQCPSSICVPGGQMSQ